MAVVILLPFELLTGPDFLARNTYSRLAHGLPAGLSGRAQSKSGSSTQLIG